MTFASSGHERSPRTPMRFQHASTAMTGSADSCRLLPNDACQVLPKCSGLRGVSPAVADHDHVTECIPMIGVEVHRLAEGSAALGGTTLRKIDHAEKRIDVGVARARASNRLAHGASRRPVDRRLGQPRAASSVSGAAMDSWRTVGVAPRPCADRLWRSGSRKARPVCWAGGRRWRGSGRALTPRAGKFRAMRNRPATNASAATGRPRRGSGPASHLREESVQVRQRPAARFFREIDEEIAAENYIEWLNSGEEFGSATLPA